MKPEALPATRYAQTDEGHVAYQVFGDGPSDVVFITGWGTNLDVMWQEPTLARYLERLASFSRVACFDKRGSGVSDPVALAELPTLERWMDDASAVMDAAELDQVTLIGDTEGSQMAMLFAATYPQKVAGLVLVNPFARWKRADDYPIGMPEDTFRRLITAYSEVWGVSADILDLTAPGAADDERLRAWLPWYSRLALAPGAAAIMYEWLLRVDVRSVLPAIQAPTLVVTRAEAQHHRAAFGRYVAENIPDVKYVELPGTDTWPFHVGDFDAVLDEIEVFMTGERAVPVPDRILATVLFTDIVGSTDLIASVGDERWIELLESHDRIVREQLARFRGEEVETTGDGFLATFDGPTRAVSCASRIAEAVRRLGIDVRAGLHTGEVELTNGKVGGLAVHIAARVTAAAPVGGVLVSSTVRDLSAGSGIEFADHGTHQLKGIPGEWPLYEVKGLP